MQVDALTTIAICKLLLLASLCDAQRTTFENVTGMEPGCFCSHATHTGCEPVGAHHAEQQGSLSTRNCDYKGTHQDLLIHSSGVLQLAGQLSRLEPSQ